MNPIRKLKYDKRKVQNKNKIRINKTEQLKNDKID